MGAFLGSGPRGATGGRWTHLLTSAGLGLDYGTLRLERTTEAWLAAGTGLRARVAGILGGTVAGVEVIGSSSVLGLLAKPIIDLVVGSTPEQPLAEVAGRLEHDGWIYRGDAGGDGGHVFVLESRPWRRVAHVHVVNHAGAQWRDYLRLRDLLRCSTDARDRYEAVKLTLVQRNPSDSKAYTSGKSDVVNALLRDGHEARDGGLVPDVERR